jgi:hypothetical protein
MITNLEQARRYFIAMGCKHFHLDRGNVARREEYYELNISPELEQQWREEEIDRQFNQFPFDTHKELGMSFSRLSDLIREFKTSDLELLLFLLDDILDDIPFMHISLILDSIIGSNATVTHGGLIEAAYFSDQIELAKEFIARSKFLLERADNNNVGILWKRGYLVDIIEHLGINEENSYLHSLREKDELESFKYHLEGAEKGIGYSMKRLSDFYRDGIGCEVDISKSIFWLEKAAKEGHKLAKEELSEYMKAKNKQGNK